MSLRRIDAGNWRWASTTKGAVALVHLGREIAEYRWNEWLLVMRVSSGEPYMLGPRGREPSVLPPPAGALHLP